MKKTLILLFLAGPLGIVFHACSPCDCPPVASYYKFEKAHFTAYKIVKKPTEEFIPLANNGIVKADSLALNIAFTRTYYSQSKSSFHFGLINSALACKCLQDGYKGTTEKILSISIFTLKDFNTQHAAGADISNIATINDLPVNNFIQNWNNSSPTLSYLSLVRFTDTMATETQQQLALHVQTTLGSFSDSTPIFTVIP